MSEEKSQKKDLRARLGRTISPNTPGAPQIPGVNAPSVPPAGVPAPPASIRGNDPMMPPFAQAQKPSVRPADPFAAAPAAAPVQNIVLSAIDDTPIEMSDAGKKRRGVATLAAIGGLVAGLVGGAMLGSVNGDNRMFNITVHEAQTLNTSLTSSSGKLVEAQSLITKVLEGAVGAGGAAPRIDYASIEALSRMENPFPATNVAGKNFPRFRADTVAGLYQYFNNVDKLWGQIQLLRAMTAENRRAQLDAAAVDTIESSQYLYGVQTSTSEGRVSATLVFAEPPAEGATQTKIRLTVSGQPRDSAVMGVDSNWGQGVILLDTRSPSPESRATAQILGERLTPFRQFLGKLREIKELMDATVVIQGQVQSQVGEIAGLSTQLAF